MPSDACTFCSTAAALVPTTGCRVCRACTKRIADLAASGKADDVWDARPPPPPPLADEMREAAARVAGELAKGAFDSHYYLAASYRQVSLYADAVREAGLATAAATGDGRATAALRMLLTPPLLREDGLAKLAARLTRMQSN